MAGIGLVEFYPSKRIKLRLINISETKIPNGIISLTSLFS